MPGSAERVGAVRGRSETDWATSPVGAAVTDARRRRGARTQAERSAAMRGRIQTAALACLQECGYAGTTFASVAERAGVSRGALQHHFVSKSLMVASALEVLTADVELDASLTAHARRPGLPRVGILLDGFWAATRSPQLAVVSEIRVAARTDEELRAVIRPIERTARLRQEAAIRDALGEVAARVPDMTPRVDAVLAVMRGLTVQLAYSGWGAEETEAAWRVARDDFLHGLGRAVRAARRASRPRPEREV